MKKDIFGLDLDELQTILAEFGMKKYRAKQIYQWLYQKSEFDFAAMTNLSNSDIAILEEHCEVLPVKLKILSELTSADGLTKKVLLELGDGNTIETVLMKFDYGYSVCVSSQVGCDMQCAFCASGLEGCVRNLTKAEIIAQVYIFNAMLRESDNRVSRIVVMGSGEPMLNFENVFGALEFLHQNETSSMSYRNMTVSTCGIIPGIERMENLGHPISLAISLHSVKQEVRTELMPVNKGYNFLSVIKAADGYANATGRRVTYEYIMLQGVNDTPEDAELLSNCLKHKNAYVNLIPANPVPEKGLLRPTQASIDRFVKILLKNNVTVTVRKEMGKDINAACGQLRASYTNKNK